MKRSVWRQVRSGNVHVNSPEEYAKLAVTCNSNIHIKFISKLETEAGEEHLNAEGIMLLLYPEHRMRS